MTDQTSEATGTVASSQKGAAIAACSVAIGAEADRQLAQVSEFAAAVFAGDDPVAAAKKGPYGKPEKAYYRAIVAAYRESADLPAIPYSPVAGDAYRMCELLLAEPGAWVAAATLSRAAHNSQVGSTLDDRALAEAGWRIEKEVNPHVQYRLVPIVAERFRGDADYNRETSGIG